MIVMRRILPCEGVFAIGEVKSTIGSKEVEDILEKIGSVRKLTRYAKATNDVFVDDDDEFTVDYRQSAAGLCFLLSQRIRMTKIQEV